MYVESVDLNAIQFMNSVNKVNTLQNIFIFLIRVYNAEGW